MYHPISPEARLERRIRRIERFLQLAAKRPLPDEESEDPQGVDDEGIEFITECEGCELEPYYDQAGWLTVGVGHLLDGPDDPYNRTITQEESDELLVGDLAETEDCLDNCIAVPVNQNQYNACASLTFNIGTGAFSDSTLLKKLNASDYIGAADQFLVWNKITVDGEKVVSEGLSNRREKERELFLTEE